MVSSTTGRPHNAVLSEEELSRLRTQRVSLKQSADLLQRSYQTVRKLAKERHIVTIKVGAVNMVTLYEIRRFLARGNATEQDWQDQSEVI